jgi:HD-GYP domain-containing protein (c-di-GMP phosphodiesterase class II)
MFFSTIAAVLAIEIIRPSFSRAGVYLVEVSVYATIFLANLNWAVWMAFLLVVTSYLFQNAVQRLQKKRPRSLEYLVLNVTLSVISFALASLVYQAASQEVPLISSTRSLVAIFLCSLTAEVSFNLLYSLFISVSSGYNLWEFWKFFPQALKAETVYLLAPIGALEAFFFYEAPLALVLLAVPLLVLLVITVSFRDALNEAYEAMGMICSTLEARDRYTSRHSERVAEYARDIALQLGLGEAVSRGLMDAGRLHDMGKITIPDKVLYKPGSLDDVEWEIMKGHVGNLKKIFGRFRFLSRKVELAYYHHERIDGKGYERGLKGDEYPLASKIISVADAYESMTADRPYRKNMPVEVAVQRIQQGSGTQFEPVVVDAFLNLIRDEIKQNLRLKIRRGEALLKQLAEKDPYTYEKSRKMEKLVVLIGARMHLSPGDMDTLTEAARFMDLGKLKVADEIIKKAGKLTVEERMKIEEHSVIGSELARDLPISEESIQLIRHHHERYDGTGYPSRLAEEEIPLGARILSVVDAFCSLTTDRPFQKSIPPSEAAARIREGSGTQFDPRVVRVLEEIQEKEA